MFLIGFHFVLFFFRWFQKASFSKFDALQKQNLANVRTGDAAKLNVIVLIYLSILLCVSLYSCFISEQSTHAYVQQSLLLLILSFGIECTELLIC